MVEPRQLDERFPDWRSVEIFGPPGAGKSFFCREFLRQRPILATCDDLATRHFVDLRLGRASRLAAHLFSQRVMKNLYKLQLDRLARRYWNRRDAEVQRYLAAVERIIRQARLQRGSEKNVRKSVRYTGLALALTYESQRQILVDEGLIRKLITLLVQCAAPDGRAELLDSIRACLAAYPWERNAVLVDAPPSLCIERQLARGHVIHRPGKSQPLQQAAAWQVLELCEEARWKTLRIWNAADDSAQPPGLPPKVAA